MSIKVIQSIRYGKRYLVNRMISGVRYREYFPFTDEGKAQAMDYHRSLAAKKKANIRITGDVKLFSKTGKLLGVSITTIEYKRVGVKIVLIIKKSINGVYTYFTRNIDSVSGLYAVIDMYIDEVKKTSNGLSFNVNTEITHKLPIAKEIYKQEYLNILAELEE